MKLQIGQITYHLFVMYEKVDTFKTDKPECNMPKIFDKTGMLPRHFNAMVYK